MERLAEQIVDWHNRHPLARRITADSVHTIGVVALPFLRASAQAGGFVEPVLTDAVSAFDALAGTPPVSRWAVWSQRLQALPRRLGRRPRQQWRAFNEKFLPGLSPARVERFALAHGFAEPPAAPETRPWRVIVIDEKLANAHGGWPFELYLMSAGIDMGDSRTRVLSGRGIPSQVIGRRLWDPKRVAAAAALLAVLTAGAAWGLWPRRAAEPPAPVAAAAPVVAPVLTPVVAPAPAASAAMAVASAPAAAPPASQADAAATPASDIAAEPPVDAASAPPPDIRPRFVQRADGKVLPPLGGGKPPEKVAGSGAASSPGKDAAKAPERSPEKLPEKPSDKPPDKPAGTSSSKAPAAEPTDPRLARLAEAPDRIAVALVGPPGTRAEAEALLKKMQASLVGVHGNPEALQADVIQTPDGWRATVWPFPSREQAQLINATLVARGLKTKAVNF